MSASVYSFAYDQGSHHSFDVSFKDSEGAPDTAAVEGFSGRGQVRRTLNGEVIAEFTITVDEESAMVTVALLADSMEGVEFATATSYKTTVACPYDVELYKVSDATVSKRILNGFVTVSPEVTRAVTP